MSQIVQIIWPTWLEVSHSQGRLVHTLRHKASKLSSLSSHHNYHHLLLIICVYDIHCMCMCMCMCICVCIEQSHTPAHAGRKRHLLELNWCYVPSYPHSVCTLIPHEASSASSSLSLSLSLSLLLRTQLSSLCMYSHSS